MTQHTEKWKWDSSVWDYDPETDAPWLVTDDAKENRILHGEIQCRSEDDARLIAAAPMLLEALKLLQIEIILSGNAGSEDYGWKPAIQKARSAIAAATGEQA